MSPLKKKKDIYNSSLLEVRQNKFTEMSLLQYIIIVVFYFLNKANMYQLPHEISCNPSKLSPKFTTLAT